MNRLKKLIDRVKMLISIEELIKKVLRELEELGKIHQFGMTPMKKIDVN